jgi:hypothetical protein
MQSASVEWRMAGNSQYQIRALAAAELGVALATNELLRSTSAVAPANIPLSQVPGASGDDYRVAVNCVGPDSDVQRASGGTLDGQHYLVHSWGTSVRGASVELEADALIVRDASGNVVRAERSYWRQLGVD